MSHKYSNFEVTCIFVGKEWLNLIGDKTNSRITYPYVHLEKWNLSSMFANYICYGLTFIGFTMHFIFHKKMCKSHLVINCLLGAGVDQA
jgi:hypothetical protein